MTKLDNTKLDKYLREKGQIGGAVLLHKLVEYFELNNNTFNLLDYNSLTLRDICVKVGYIWLQNIERDNCILALDSAIAHF